MIGDRFFSVFRTSARGLEAQRIAMATATENIANATTTRTDEGTPYARKRAVHNGPDQTRVRFEDVFNTMSNRLQQLHELHFPSRSLGVENQPGDLGPQTDVQAEMVLRTEYDPTHPHADANGYVQYPDINVVDEMARMMSANRVYEANLTAVQAAKEMIKRTLEI